MDALIGISGFIGSNIAKKFETITSVTRSDLLENHKRYDVERLFIAAPSANKWKIASNPQEDLENIQTLVIQLKNSILANQVILFSTVDVYKDVSDSTENSETLTNCSYGGNRFIFESEIRSSFSNVRILRLGGLFGPNLRKNLIYDLKNRKLDQLSAINPRSQFQYLSIGKVLDYSIASDKSVLNVVGPPILASEIAGGDSRFLSIERPVVNYNIRSVHIDTGYLYKKDEILCEIHAFTSGEYV
jgi:nucleoside-diphosphate-sugar epimerase